MTQLYINCKEASRGKKVAIMQPYFFPYMGYIELARSVDYFIFLDDVNFIKKGWINRNQVRNLSGIQRINIPLQRISQNRLIKDTLIHDYEKFKHDIMKILISCYSDVKNFQNIKEDITKLLALFTGVSVADFNIYTLRWAFDNFGIDCATLRSSDLKIDEKLMGEERIIALCNKVGADTYINPISGRHLYSESNFKNNGIELTFLDYNTLEYKQFINDDFIPNLSYLDYMMFGKSLF